MLIFVQKLRYTIFFKKKQLYKKPRNRHHKVLRKIAGLSMGARTIGSNEQTNERTSERTNERTNNERTRANKSTFQNN